jgi:hypothetical protein
VVSTVQAARILGSPAWAGIDRWSGRAGKLDLASQGCPD